jgi:thiol-disulfide isomerase/thioredoxin
MIGSGNRWGVVGIAALVGLVWSLAGTAAEILRHEPREPAPPLELVDLSDVKSDLSGVDGRVVLVNFWASWCAPCLVEMPAMQRLQERLADRRFTVLAVNAGEGRDRIWRTRQRLGLHFPMLQDPGRKVTRAWEVDLFPTSFLMDAEGRVAYTIRGMLDWNGPKAQSLIETLLLPVAGKEDRSDGPDRCRPPCRR